ncbi:MAG: ATP-grasp domain-containing protein [Pseudomonadota bacterium]
MRHFIFEFITGGGLAGQALSSELAKEGGLMVQAIINDLRRMNTSEVSLFQDSRLAIRPDDVDVIEIADDKYDSIFKYLQTDDCLWLIAPESNQYLINYVSECEKRKLNHFLSDSNTIKICSNKLLTNNFLGKAGLPVIPSYIDVNRISEHTESFIIKPLYGAGAEDIFYLQDKACLTEKINELENDFIFQPYLEGESLSLSMLCAQGKHVLLACNEQHITVNDNQFKLSALDINTRLSEHDVLSRIACDITAALPGLFGYIGVDLIKQSNRYYIVDINPRLSTSYAALFESTGINVLAQIIKLKSNTTLPKINIQQAKPVRLDL